MISVLGIETKSSDRKSANVSPIDQQSTDFFIFKLNFAEGGKLHRIFNCQSTFQALTETKQLHGLLSLIIIEEHVVDLWLSFSHQPYITAVVRQR